MGERGKRRVVEPKARPSDEIRLETPLARLATGQDGIVTRPQLVCLGFGHQAIDRRLASGSLIALFRGVYAVGHGAVSERGSAIAARSRTIDAREAARQARGDLVVRFTWRQVTGERVRVATRLAQTLAVRGR